jgi:hypothetical protein
MGQGMKRKVDAHLVAEYLSELTMIPFFPGDEGARAGLMRMVCAMATHEDQVRWLVDRVLQLYGSKWPGPVEIRAVFCSKYKPADGINAHSEIYIDGIPSESGYDPLGPPKLDRAEEKAIGRAMLKLLGPPDAAESVDMARPKPKPRPAVPPLPPGKAITQADIDRAVRELHDRRIDEAVKREIYGETGDESKE